MERNRDTGTGTGKHATIRNQNKGSDNQRNIHNVTGNDIPLQLLSSFQVPAIDGLNFPSIMHIMLSAVGEHHNNREQEEIVSWQPHGRCFVVHRVHEFEQLFLNR
jgi:hypothetical protein